MKNFVRLSGSHALRPIWLAAAAVSVIAAVGGAVGIAAGPGHAAATLAVAKASHPAKAFGYGHRHRGHAKLKRGVLIVKGTRASDTIALRLKAGNPGILQVDFGGDGLADFSFQRSKVARIDVDARAGDDFVRIDESNGAFTNDFATTIDGGDGSDTLAGGAGVEALLGGAGNDSVDGNGGNDLALLGAGDDTFVWDPGDGSDTIEGQDGTDTMVFNGANADEQVALSANGNRLRFFRIQANITMDTAGVERVDFNALGGADLVTVNDLSGTDVDTVTADLAGTLAGSVGDGAADRVVVNATNGNDGINVSGDAAEVKVTGLAATTRILHSEAANDRLEVNTLAGTDTVTSVGLAAGAIQLFVDGVLVP